MQRTIFKFSLSSKGNLVKISLDCRWAYLPGLPCWYIISIRFLLVFLVTFLWIQYFLGSLLQQLLKAKQRRPNSAGTHIYYTCNSSRSTYKKCYNFSFFPFSIPCGLIKTQQRLRSLVLCLWINFKESRGWSGVWEGSWHGWTWLKFAEKTFKGGGGWKGAHVYIRGGGGQYLLNTLSTQKAICRPFIAPAPSKGVQKVEHVVNLEGWLELGRFLKALEGGSIPAGMGRTAQPAAGEAPSAASGTSVGFLSSWISPLFPPTPSGEMGTDVPHCRNAEQLKEALGEFIAVWFGLVFFNSLMVFSVVMRISLQNEECTSQSLFHLPQCCFFEGFSRWWELGERCERWRERQITEAARLLPHPQCCFLREVKRCESDLDAQRWISVPFSPVTSWVVPVESAARSLPHTFADPIWWAGADGWPMPKPFSGLLPTVFIPYSFNLQNKYVLAIGMYFPLRYQNTRISIFAFYWLLATTLQEGPQVKLIACMNFGRQFLKDTC